MTCPGPKCSLPQNPLLPRAGAAVGGSAVGPATCSSQRKRDRVITFLLPSCFLTLSGFRFNPSATGPSRTLMGAAALLLGDGAVLRLPLGSPSESLIEGGVESTIPLKKNHIPALIVSTPGFGPAPCRGRHGDRLARVPSGTGLARLLVPPARTKRRHSRAQTAVESLALPEEPFPPSSPPRHRCETVAWFSYLSHPCLLFPTRSVALFRERNVPPCPRQWRGRCISERRRGERQDSRESVPVMGQEPYLPL